MADTSTQQMALTRDVGPGGFMERVQAMLAFTAGIVLTESIATPHHQGRAVYAQKVVASPPLTAQQSAPQIVMGVNVINATVYDEETKTSTCSIADIDLQSQILTLWNSLAGLDTAA